MAQFWNPQGQPQAGSAPTPQSPEEAAYWAAPASTRAFMVRPGSTEWNRRQADQVVNDQQFAAAGITDPFGYALQGAGRPTAPNRGATPAPSPAPTPMALPTAQPDLTMPSPSYQPSMPTGMGYAGAGPSTMPPAAGQSQSFWQPPAGMGMTNTTPVQRPQPYMPPQFNASQPQPSLWQPPSVSAAAPQPYMPPQDNASQPQQTPTLGNNQASPVQLPGSVLGQMTPKPYQPTNFSPAPRTTQSNGGAVSGYSGNPAFAAYSRRRGL